MPFYSTIEGNNFGNILVGYSWVTTNWQTGAGYNDDSQWFDTIYGYAGDDKIYGLGGERPALWWRGA